MRFWGIAQTEHQGETRAAFFLARADFEFYFPRIRINRGPKQRTVPLFPGYLFVQISDQWYRIESTIGVTKLIKFGGVPGHVQDDVVEKIRGR